MTRGTNRCDYATRPAGKTYDGRPAMLDGHGDRTILCGKLGRPMPHTFKVKKPGTTAVYLPIEGTVMRCSEHEARYPQPGASPLAPTTTRLAPRAVAEGRRSDHA